MSNSRHKFVSRSITSFTMFEEGKFNPNALKMFNFMLGYIDRPHCRRHSKVDYGLEIMK